MDEIMTDPELIDKAMDCAHEATHLMVHVTKLDSTKVGADELRDLSRHLLRLSDSAIILAFDCIEGAVRLEAKAS